MKEGKLAINHRWSFMTRKQAYSFGSSQRLVEWKYF